MSSPFPRFAFVDAPKLDATDRLVLTSGAGRITKTEFSLGAPTMSGTPGQAGVEWGYRDLKLRVRIRGTRSDATKLLQALAREVLRAENWLLVHLGPEDVPVWFRTYRTQPGELDLSNDFGAGDPDRTVGQWSISVPLSADSFAYGERVTLPAVTVHNDPAAGSNPCSYVLPPILGDAPTPLRISANPSNRGTVGGYTWLQSLHACTEPSAAPITLQIGVGDGWTAGDDTNSPSTDASFSGGSLRVVTFATTTDLVDRIYGTTPVPVPAGRYKVLVRIARGSVDSTFSLRFGLASLGRGSYGDTQLMDRPPSIAANHATWVDLGDFTFPLFTGVPLEEAGAAVAHTIGLQVGRLSGGSAVLDVIQLLPLDVNGTIETRTLVTDLPMAKAYDVAGRDIWDGEYESYWKVDASGDVIPAPRPDMAGGFPRAYPDAYNTLSLFQQVNGNGLVDDNSDVISATTDVVVSYYPLYLNLAGTD